MGHGRQPVPWIHLDDAVGLFEHFIDREDARGCYNAVSPGVVSNREFTERFAKHWRRPVLWSAPAWLVRAVVGKDRASILIDGQRIKPKRVVEAGYRFRYPLLDDALSDLVRVVF
jgi:uncharacterized protein